MKKVHDGIIIDGFTLKQNNCLYFLTHWHADHYMGISNKWPYGSIYTSSLTRQILLTKYPKLSQVVIGLQIGIEYQLMNPKSEKTFRVILFSANHMAGSAMILLKLQNDKTILHTGDMRFNASVLQKQDKLFEIKDQKSSLYKCKYHIHELYLDNTYCDPIFQFPNRSDALAMTKQIIDRNIEKVRRVYLVTHSIGKQEALIALSIHYRTKIVVCDERYEYVQQIFGEATPHYFSMKQNEGWIQAIKPHQKQLITKYATSQIVITLTGWANLRDYHQFSQHQFIVPYSLHSNYEELELFVSVIRADKIFPVVNQHNDKKSRDFRKTIHSYGSYFNSLMHMKQRGFQFLQSNYTKASELTSI